MKFELKNIKFSEFASRETYCYEATLYIDGQRSYIVSNDGCGGCDNIHGIQGVTAKYTLDDIREYFLKQPKYKHEGYNFEVQPSLDDVCGDLLTEHLYTKYLKRDLKRGLLFTKKGDPTNLYTVSRKSGAKDFTDAELLESITDDIDIVLNGMSFADALPLYIELSGY